MMRLVSKTVDQSPIALGSSAPHSPWDTQSTKFEFGSHQCGETCGGNDRIPLLQSCLITTWRYPGTMLAILRKSTRMCCKNLWSSTGRRYTRHRRQRDDLGNIYVRNNGSRGTSWTYNHENTTKNTNFEKVNRLVEISQKMIKDQNQEIQGYLRLIGAQYHG